MGCNIQCRIFPLEEICHGECHALSQNVPWVKSGSLREYLRFPRNYCSVLLVNMGRRGTAS